MVRLSIISSLSTFFANLLASFVSTLHARGFTETAVLLVLGLELLFLNLLIRTLAALPAQKQLIYEFKWELFL
jgi:hypothetical protein